MICDWRSVKTGRRTRQREPLSPPTIPYWLPAIYGLCVRAVTYVRHAVILYMPRTFERSRDRRLRACQDMKDGCTAASAPSAKAERPPVWEEATTEHSENARWLNANVWSWPIPGLATKKCMSRLNSAEWNDSFPGYYFDDDDYRDGWRTGGLFILRSPDVADGPREFCRTLVMFMNQQTRFWRETCNGVWFCRNTYLPK
jgi:hypothetical protein